MFIHLIRGTAAGLAATAFLSTAYSVYTGEWIAVLFGLCATGIFLDATRMTWKTRVRSRLEETEGQRGPFRTLSGKLLIALIVGGFIVGTALTIAVDALIAQPGTGYGPAALGYGLYGFIALGLWDVSRRHRIDFGRLRGKFPSTGDVWKRIVVVIPLLLFSYGTVWVVYYPLSILSPELVEVVLLADDLFARTPDGSLAIGPNVLTAFSLILLAPVTEEIFFRGYLLHRWAVTWGIPASVVASTVVFASLHANPLGALLFGFVMAVIYLKTKSLGLVIVIHILNNSIAYGTGVLDTVLGDAPTINTIAEFRAAWWMAAIALGLSLPWAVHFVRRHWPDDSWELPYQSGASS